MCIYCELLLNVFLVFCFFKSILWFIICGFCLFSFFYFCLVSFGYSVYYISDIINSDGWDVIKVGGVIKE